MALHASLRLSKAEKLLWTEAPPAAGFLPEVLNDIITHYDHIGSAVLCEFDDRPEPYLESNLGRRPGFDTHRSSAGRYPAIAACQCDRATHADHHQGSGSGHSKFAATQRNPFRAGYSGSTGCATDESANDKSTEWHDMRNRTDCTGRSIPQLYFDHTRRNYSGRNESGFDESRFDKSGHDKSNHAGSQSRQYERGDTGKSVADKSRNAVCRFAVPAARCAARKRSSAFDVEGNFREISFDSAGCAHSALFRGRSDRWWTEIRVFSPAGNTSRESTRR